MERLEDARCLHDGGRFQGAIYLCGYALECELKFCVCRSRKVAHMQEGEAKQLGHSLPELLDKAGLARLLHREDLREAFHRINRRWSTEIRYSGGASNDRESGTFLRDSEWLLSWLRTESKA